MPTNESPAPSQPSDNDTRSEAAAAPAFDLQAFADKLGRCYRGEPQPPPAPVPLSETTKPSAERAIDKPAGKRSPLNHFLK